VHRLSLVLGAVIGLSLGCAGASPKSSGWFDACCESCSADVCEGCSEKKKGACGERLPGTPAECLLDNDMLMCRPLPAKRA
jgi:hypothetical protein